MSTIQLIYDSTCASSSGAGCSWVVPAGVTYITFEVWGGGGGGGNPGASCNCCDRGGPGGGGGYAKASISTVAGCTYAVCAGYGGFSTWGSYCGICCNGCGGGTSYVTGYNLSNLCATGGTGGPSDFNTVCYSICGCNFCGTAPGGIGYGGQIVANGGSGISGMYSSTNPLNIFVHGGNAGGPGGGAGGINSTGDWINSCSACAYCGDHSAHGRIPGGGGAGSGYYSCCQCTPWASGKGAPGMVKITY